VYLIFLFVAHGKVTWICLKSEEFTETFNTVWDTWILFTVCRFFRNLSGTLWPVLLIQGDQNSLCTWWL
jgi:hypothetical protein